MMGKRLTDTDKWRKAWFRKLSPRLKCFWQFLCDECDCAGVWSEDFEIASALVGEPVSAQDYEVFGGRIVRLGPDKVFIERFLEFQYDVGRRADQPKLNPKSNIHLGVIRKMRKHGIDSSPWREFLGNDACNFNPCPTLAQPLANPCPRVKDKDQDKDKNLDKEKEEGGLGGDFDLLPKPELPMPDPEWSQARTLDRAIDDSRARGEDTALLEAWRTRIQFVARSQAPA